MILVTGATGTVGQALVPKLLERGDEVRVLVRDPRKLGRLRVEVRIALGDLTELADPRVVRQALASLFERGIDPMLVIRWKDIFERLEDAIDATETTANILEGIVIKNA